MKSKLKLSLKNLDVKSFITENNLSLLNTVKGGVSISGPFCTATQTLGGAGDRTNGTDCGWTGPVHCG